MRFTCFTPSSCFDLEFTACNGLQDAIPMGVCTSGFMKGHMLVRRTSCTLMWCTVPFSSCIHMFASNIFGVLQGEAVQIFTSKNMVADKDTIATLLDTSNSRLSMKMSRFIEPSPKCNGISLKTVVHNGTSLNAANAFKAAEAWLQKHNDEIAPIYGLSKLVWCERLSSKRRVFYRVDMQDDMKRKTCANVGDAIQHMEKFTESCFYDDIRLASEHYVLK